ncbi:response regulator [Catenulispora subtropica]|uniref:Response regulator n=1 Tax=Catenulispora subtropica TaxID=450798 RepID=A0ABN2SIY6_9ACTN
MIKVLVVDDEPQLLRALRINLTARKYEVVTAVDGTSALALAARTLPDLVVLDLGLPDLDGAEVIKGLRGWTEVPIVVLSGRADASDKVEALDAGADDYLTKPFSMEELLARLRVARRHADRNAPKAAVQRIGDFDVDVAAHSVTRSADAPSSVPGSVHLTPTEWGIVEVLLKNAGRLVSAKQLLSEVWGHGYENDTPLLRFHFTKLRRKLEREPSRPEHLLTEPGMGYRFQP